MKDKDRRGSPGCRAEPPPRPPLRCGGTGNGAWRGERGPSAPLRAAAAPWPVPVAGARWRSASRHRRAARLRPRGAPRPRCRPRKTRAALGGWERSRASPGECPAARHSSRGGGKGARGSPLVPTRVRGRGAVYAAPRVWARWERRGAPCRAATKRAGQL